MSQMTPQPEPSGNPAPEHSSDREKAEKAYPTDKLQNMVIWIEQDSTTQPDEYLEECNTHQNGE
jgi:hypothetical protein